MFLVGLQRCVFDARGGTRRPRPCLLDPGFAPLLEDALSPVELLDALPVADVGDEEAVALLRQLVDHIIHRGVGARDDADRLPLGDEGCDQVEDSLRLSCSRGSINDRDLVCERCAYAIALINVGVKRHDDLVSGAGCTVGGAREKCLQGGAAGYRAHPLPHVCQDRCGNRVSLTNPLVVASARVQARPCSPGLRADLLAHVVERGGALTILRGRVRRTDLAAAVSPDPELPISLAVCERVAHVARVVPGSECPDDLDVRPALPAHAYLIEGVNGAALDLVVNAYPALAVRKLLAVGVGDDDTLPIAARLRDFPGAVLPVRSFLVPNQYVHCP